MRVGGLFLAGDWTETGRDQGVRPFKPTKVPPFLSQSARMSRVAPPE